MTMDDNVYLCTCSFYHTDETPTFFIHADSDLEALKKANEYAHVHYAEYMPNSARILSCGREIE